MRSLQKSATFTFLSASALALAACGGGNARDANAPLSPAAQKVEVVGAAPPTCKKLGTATGVGRDLNEKVADQQATDAAREQTAKLGGDTAHVVTETNEPEAGSGGTYARITKTVDVYQCAK
jgi:hypothetical protein